MRISTTRATVCQRPRDFEVVRLPIADPGPGEVVLTIIVAGVCGTDLHVHGGEFGPLPRCGPGGPTRLA